MIDIPLSSIIVEDQPSDNSSAQNNSENAEPQLIGTGPLRSANKLCIKQRIRASDIVSLLTGCEVSFIPIYFNFSFTKVFCILG